MPNKYDIRDKMYGELNKLTKECDNCGTTDSEENKVQKTEDGIYCRDCIEEYDMDL